MTTLTTLGANMVGGQVGETITRSKLFDNSGFCGDDESGYIIDSENIDKETLEAHVFLTKEMVNES